MSSLSCCLQDCAYAGCRESDCTITSSSCLSKLESYCLGTTLSDEEWVRAWTQSSVPNRETPDCVYFLSRTLLRETPPLVQDLTKSVPQASLFRNSETISSLRSFMQQVFNNYQQRGYLLGSLPNSRTFTPLEYSLYSVCRNVPGICTQPLQEFCSFYSGSSLSRNPSLAKWCGCYLPDVEYKRYVDNYSVTKQCTPYCIREEAVPLASPSGSSPLTCQQNVCILDDVAINLQNSSVRGGASFTQICGDCGKGGRCSCVTSNISITAINSEIQGIDFTQNCSAQSSTCTRNVGGGIELEVPCFRGEDIQKNVASDYQSALRSRNVKIFLLIFAVIILLFLIFLSLSLLR